MSFLKITHLAAILITIMWITINIPREYMPEIALIYYDKFLPLNTYTEPPRNKKPTVTPINIETICPPLYKDWRQRKVIDNITIQEVKDCVPDNPWDVAVSVLGSNRASPETLSQSLLAKDAVIKKDDLDGDGDPDVIEIRLEVMELNGKSPDEKGVIPRYEIAPGVTPGLWVFSPKSKGMSTINADSPESNRIVRLPGPVIRVEEGDEITLVLENSHYMPHTIHLHGADHPFETPDGTGNDGVPVFNEHPTMPGSAKKYWLRPRHPGTMFYHCHVQPHAHIFMGLQGMLVVEKNEENNLVQTFNMGAGAVRYMSARTRRHYDGEYDLHYADIDSSLNNRIQKFTDPRLISRSVHREYNPSHRKTNYHLLNGRSFPYTLKESLVHGKPSKKYKLRVLNGGGSQLALHVHGHKPLLTHLDGVALGEHSQKRDVFEIATAQRIDLDLNTMNNGLDSYGSGSWLMHDHYPQGVTTNGIGPGGGLSIVTYPDYVEKNGLPKTLNGLEQLSMFFAADYYKGRLPVFFGMKNNKLLDPDAANNSKSQLSLSVAIAFLLLLILLYSFVWKTKER